MKNSKGTPTDSTSTSTSIADWQGELLEYIDGHIITLPQGHTHYYVYGVEGGSSAPHCRPLADDSSLPWIVMIHGFTMNSALFHPLATRLVKQFKCRVLVYDVYGRGYSATPAGKKFDAELFRAQLWDLVDRVIGPTAKVHLLGYSMGSAISALSSVGQQYANRVLGVTLMVPPGMGNLGLRLAIRVLTTRWIGTALCWLVGQRLAIKGIVDGTAARQEFHDRTGMEVAMDKFNRVLLRSWSNPHFIWTATGTFKDLTQMQKSNLAPTIQLISQQSSFPVDVMLAEFDNTCPGNAELWRSSCPRVKVWILPTGHMGLWEDFPKFYDVVRSICVSRGFEARL